MFKIRNFAEIAQVPMSTLRYYDEVGIFKPMHVDPATGYRYYSMDQLLQLNRILALKDLGIELAQIVQLLDEGVSTEALQGMLRLKQARLQQHIQAEQERLTRIEARLKYIDLDGTMPTHDVIMKSVSAYTVASSYTYVTGFVLNVQYAGMFLDMLRKYEIKPTGPITYLYHEGSSSERDLDVEVTVPIERSPKFNIRTDWQSQITIHELPEVSKMASTLYHGSPHAIAEGYQALGIWIGANGYKITGPCRKICLRWSGELDDYLTEIQFPVERAH